MSKSRHLEVIPLLLACLVLPFLMPVLGQQQFEPFRGNPVPRHPRTFTDGDWPGEYTFARIVYDSPYSPYERWFGGAWRVDYPEADYNFMMGIREWAGSNLHLAGRQCRGHVMVIVVVAENGEDSFGGAEALQGFG